MRDLPADPRPSDFAASIEGFAMVASRLSGRPASAFAGEGARAALAALGAGGLWVPSDARGLPCGDAANPAATTAFVMRAARRVATGDRSPVATVPSEAFSPAPASVRYLAALSSLPGAVDCLAEAADSFAPRWYPLDEGAIHCGHFGLRLAGVSATVATSDMRVTVLRRRRDGRVSFASKAVRPEHLAPARRFLSLGGAWRPAMGVGTLVDAWSRSALHLRGPGAAGRTSTNPALSSWIARRLRRLGAPAPPRDFDPFAFEADAAMRGFLANAPGAASEAVGHLSTLWEDADLLGACMAHAFFSRFVDPARFGQAFSAAPVLATAVLPTARRNVDPAHGGGPFDDLAEAVVADVARGVSVRRVSGNLAGAILGRPPGPVAASAFRRYDGIDAFDPLFLAILDSAFSRVPRHRPLNPVESAAITSSVYRVCEVLEPEALRRDATAPGFALRFPGTVAACMANADGWYVALDHGVADALEWFVSASVRAGLSRDEAVVAAVEAFFPRGRGRAALDRVVAEWHETVDALDAQETAVRIEVAGQYVSDLDLSPLFPVLPPFKVPVGMKVKRLASMEDCRREGREMGHCVASFRERAAAGEVYILSIRDASGRSTASLDVAFGQDGFASFSVGQVKGRRNSEPSLDHVAFVAALVRDLNGCGVATALRRLVDPAGRRCPRAAFARRVKAALRCGAAAEDAERLLPPVARDRLADAAFEGLRGFLPKAQRTGDRVAWIEALARRRGIPERRTAPFGTRGTSAGRDAGYE